MKFLAGFVVGALTVDALTQFVWITDQWEKFTREVDQKMANTPWRAGLRNRYRTLVRQQETDSITRELENLLRDQG